jgi:hypothetical protein
MLGLSPDQQGHLFHAAAISVMLLIGLAPVWWQRQYTLRGLVKRLRYHL